MPNVVIVDDQATDRKILDRLTRNLAVDIEVHAFSRPSEALAWLRENQPDLILCDYRMPEMDGIEFIETLSRIPACTGIPIVVITVVDDSDLRYRALAAGATDFLNKPLDLQECEARCRNLLTLRRQQITIARNVQRLSEARRRTGRALRTLSLGNELLIGTRSEQELQHGTCRIIVEQAGYPLARVALWDDQDELHESACVPVGARMDATSLSNPACRALTEELRIEGDVKFFNDLATDVVDDKWLRNVQAAGFQSVALLPIRIEGLVDGVLAAFSHEAQPFDQDEVELLVRTANNLGYGLADRRARRARDRAERDCRYLTHFDRLTGLPNRNRLLERMRELLESDESLDDGLRDGAVLVINLDRFKLVNDTTGHQVGDQLLLQVVKRLQAVVRENDLLARQSGDEFVLLTCLGRRVDGIDDTDMLEKHAERMARRAIETMRRPFELAGYEYYIGASVGIGRIDRSSSDVHSPLRQADTAMRQAKEAGGNTYSFYSGDLTERHTRRLSLEGRLRRAIEQNDFVLHYQPIVALESGRTVGVEALVRWPQEDGSLLLPDAFIPLAEETGLMEGLGECVARMACEQARAWEQQGHNPNISINLSVHQLLRPNFAEEFADLLEQYEAKPARFELEVTESTMMTDPERTEGVVRALHERGLGIALDDFGMGYSSLSRLKHLPITTLKIDKAFVLGLPSDPAERTIVQSIVQLAENLELRAIAEGIESVEHQAILQRMGCEFGQGFLFNQPVPADQLEPVADTGDLGPDGDGTQSAWRKVPW